jgi:glycosyltransferase involved in cell wall biosynthesis
MVLPVAYDITRLATRVLNRTPNGIDRVDSAFARHFLDPVHQDRSGLMMTVLGPRMIVPSGARDIVSGISSHWGEDETPDHGKDYRRIVAWIGNRSEKSSTAERIERGRAGRASGALRWIGQHGFPLGRAPIEALPKGAVYLNVSQFPLWFTRYFRWMNERPDVKPVFFIHDLLPIETPEYFRKGEYERHQRRLKNLAQFGAAAIVTTQVVRSALDRHLRLLGRTDMPILVAPIPAAPIFSRREASDPDLLGHPYFVVCSTIEPRKNHLMLLHVWRELVRRDGAAAPKLILVGTRGWENENVVDLLERCQAISTHVLEVSGLSTPSLKRLLDSACALLMPSFAEGYGLPVAEALAAGVPVIASDLQVFREIGGDRITAVSPIDGEKWLETIRVFARSGPAERRAVLAGREVQDLPNWESYFPKIESFLASL